MISSTIFVSLSEHLSHNRKICLMIGIFVSFRIFVSYSEHLSHIRNICLICGTFVSYSELLSHFMTILFCIIVRNFCLISFRLRFVSYNCYLILELFRFVSLFENCLIFGIFKFVSYLESSGCSHFL